MATLPDNSFSTPHDPGVYASFILNLLHGREKAFFVRSAVLFSLCLIGIASNLYPYIILPSVTLGTPSAQPLTQIVMFVMVGLMLPPLLIYNAYQYRGFRNKMPSQHNGWYAK